MKGPEPQFSGEHVINLAVQFAREASGGFYPRKANQAMHDAQDHFWADRAGMDLAAFQKVLEPTTILQRLLRWWHDLRCPPIDSRKPSRLVDLEDFLACPSPLANTMQWATQTRQGKVNDDFSERLCEAIERETEWQPITYEKREPNKDDEENGTFLAEAIATFHAVFAMPHHNSLIALIRERPTDPDAQELSLGLSFVPDDQRAALEKFVK